MDFFESQETAKRNTTKLVVLFVLAVLSLIIVTNFLVMVVFGFIGNEMADTAAGNSLLFDWQTFVFIGAAVSAIVLTGSLYKLSALSGGGARIAEMMNGRLLLAGNRDLAEQRVLNVVEEMALASGTPVPPVYVMEESGINAFAAGYSPSDAVIGVTRGTIDTLSRDQLQGVIAHEFSHILHGDMRINIRLIGILYGIMVLGIIGFHLLRGGSYSRRSKDSAGIVFLGIGLMVVGYVGTFFGNLIKAAVSRQREFLADASAVQYTRNPGGIAGALMQIANHAERSYLNNPNSAEISHALFEEATLSPLRGLYATHPPLEKRISAILPGWDGSFDLIRRKESQPEPAMSAENERSRQERMAAILTGATGVLLTENIIRQVGNPGIEQLEYAGAIQQQIPQEFLDAAHEASGARSVIYYLVLNSTDPVRRQQIALLQENADPGVYQELLGLLTINTNERSLKPEHRLPLVEIAIASLRQLSNNQYRLFKNNFNELIKLDKKINLLEWALQKNVFHHLDAVFSNKRPKLGSKELKSCQNSVALLLSILAQSNQQQGITTEEAFELGAMKLDFELRFIAAQSIEYTSLNDALDELAQLKPLQKPALLKACAACITADRQVDAIEAELMRAIAATLDCPMPPILT
ncbi:MAG: M48 family metallopeptidase [Proteobacteria bacterium]|nr:M48 family metallopeptidase [Pseudomonadota bacterium]